jgi:hypothetical protein
LAISRRQRRAGLVVAVGRELVGEPVEHGDRDRGAAAGGDSGVRTAGSGPSGEPYTFTQPVLDTVSIAAADEQHRKPRSDGHFTDMCNICPRHGGAVGGGDSP